jgi:hypothetical protein
MGSWGRVSQLEGGDDDSSDSESEASGSDGEAPVPVIEAADPEVETLNATTFLRGHQERLAAAAAVEAPETEASSSDGGALIPVVETPDPEADTLHQATARWEPTDEQFMAAMYQAGLREQMLQPDMAEYQHIGLAVLDVEAPNPQILLRGRLDEIIVPRAVRAARPARREQVPRQVWVECQRARYDALAAADPIEQAWIERLYETLAAFATDVDAPRPITAARHQDMLGTYTARARLDGFRARAAERQHEELDAFAANTERPRPRVADRQQDILDTQMARASARLDRYGAARTRRG